MTSRPRSTYPRTPIPVAVLGATGAVGQAFVRMLDGHPWFRLDAVAASERSQGKRYREATRWLDGRMPERVAELTLQPCDPISVTAPVVFSALDAAAAMNIEAAFARAGRFVLSNARSFRMEPDVPLVIPEVNPDHLALIGCQRSSRGWNGVIVTNANCATIVVAMTLAPLHREFGVEQLFVTTMQAISGAGYPGVPALDILGNAIPYIANEEEKIETETLKILGEMDGSAVAPAAIRVSAQANRVAVEHGHTACMSVGLRRDATPDEAREVLASWRGAIASLDLPSAPSPPLIVASEPDRPQPRRDAAAGAGMAVTVGRIRRDPILSLRLVACGHNTIRGAAGASILNAELLVARGIIPSGA